MTVIVESRGIVAAGFTSNKAASDTVIFVSAYNGPEMAGVFPDAALFTYAFIANVYVPGAKMLPSTPIVVERPLVVTTE